MTPARAEGSRNRPPGGGKLGESGCIRKRQLRKTGGPNGPHLRSNERQSTAGEVEQLSVVDVLHLPRRIRIVMKEVRVLGKRAEFVDIGTREQLIRSGDALFAKTDERPK